MYTVNYEKGEFYLHVKGFRMYKFKKDERLYEMLEGTKGGIFPIDKEKIELNTFPMEEKDWYGNNKRETLYVLK